MKFTEKRLKETIQNRIQFLRVLGENVCQLENKRLHVWHTNTLNELVTEYNETYGNEFGKFVL